MFNILWDGPAQQGWKFTLFYLLNYHLNTYKIKTEKFILKKYLAHRLLDAGLSRYINLLGEITVNEWRIWLDHVLQTISYLQ